MQLDHTRKNPRVCIEMLEAAVSICTAKSEAQRVKIQSQVSLRKRAAFTSFVCCSGAVDRFPEAGNLMGSIQGLDEEPSLLLLIPNDHKEIYECPPLCTSHYAIKDFCH